MPKVYRRNCDWCGDRYEGYGERFCSIDCANDNHRSVAEGSPDEFPDTGGEVVVDTDEQVVYVSGRPNAVTPQELFEEAGLDPKRYEMDGHGEMKTWTVTLKMRDGDRDEVYHVRNHGTRIKFRERIDESFRFRPVVVNLNTRVARARSTPGRSLLVYADRHVPFNDPRVDSLILKVCDIVRPEAVRSLGDDLDAETLGTYDRAPDAPDELDQDIIDTAKWYGTMTEQNPWCDDFGVIFGNHEHRLTRVVWKESEGRQIGALLRLPQVREQLEWHSLLGLDSLGWKSWQYTEHELFKGRLILTHGDSTGKYPEAAELARYGKSGCSGHTHRIGCHYTRTYDAQRSWHGIGMTGMIRNDFVKFADWQQGFGIYSFDDEWHRWSYEQVFVHDGVTFFRGLRIEADPSTMEAA